MDAWFDEIEGVSELEQGDLVAELPMYLPAANGDGFLSNEGLGIVLTQSCDLAHENPRPPVDLVLVAKVYDLAEIQQRNPSFNSKEMLEQIRLNIAKDYFMLALDPSGSYPLRLVALRETCLLSRKLVEDKAAGHVRLRLRKPMRESLGSVYGNLFSRVAIDTNFELPPFAKPKGVFEKAENALGALTSAERAPLIDKYLGDSVQVKDWRTKDAHKRAQTSAEPKTK